MPVTLEVGYWVLGSALFRLGQPREALAVLAEGHVRLDAVSAPRKHHGNLFTLESLIHVALGEEDAAREAADAGLGVARETGDLVRLALSLGTAGRAWFSQDTDVALAFFEEAAEMWVSFAVAPQIAFSLDGAAQLRARAGDRAAALAYLRRAIAASHDIGNRVTLSMSLERAVITLADTGDPDVAALCAGVVQTGRLTAFRTLPQADRTAGRLAERMGPAAYDDVVRP